MATDVLVAYATKHGATREVAEAVAGHLRDAGLSVELQAAREVTGVEPYSAVVIGAPLYMGRWLGDGRRFLRRNRKGLLVTPFAVFALGPLEATDAQFRGAREQLDRALDREHDLVPSAVEVFGGALHRDELRFPFNKMPESDIRDWDAIRDWALGLPEVLGVRAVLRA